MLVYPGFYACFEIISIFLMLILSEEQIPSITSNAGDLQRPCCIAQNLLQLFQVDWNRDESCRQSPHYLGMFSAGFYLILICNSLTLFSKVVGFAVLSTALFQVSIGHGWLCLLTCSSEELLTVSPNVTDLPRPAQVEHAALIVSSYPLT